IALNSTLSKDHASGQAQATLRKPKVTPSGTPDTCLISTEAGCRFCFSWLGILIRNTSSPLTICLQSTTMFNTGAAPETAIPSARKLRLIWLYLAHMVLLSDSNWTG